MLFNSLTFGIFLLIVYVLYWTVFNRNIRLRNLFLLIASYYFYCSWNWKLLSLIIIVSTVDYVFGALIGKKQQQEQDTTKQQKLLLTLALIINLGILAYFKYFNFFIESFSTAFQFIGISSHPFSLLNIILPVGISFYTFQGLSYVLDIYRKTIPPTKDPIAFYAFLSFFPQLVAGPIERAKDLLPQFFTPKQFDYETTRSGLVNLAIGLFKKIVIADRLAIYVDAVYANPTQAAGLPSIIAMLFFAFQLYLDFSAYSQIALGTAQMFGFKLSINFNRPYLATSFKEFWKRWHITLTSWFRDYLYFPLGGNRKGTFRTFLNVMIIFSVSGLWHGASWNFVIWGTLNGLFLAVFDKTFHLNPKNIIGKITSGIFVVLLWALTLIFFRSATFSDAIQMFANLGFGNYANICNFGLQSNELKFTFAILALLMLGELFMNTKAEKIRNWFYNSFFVYRWSFYLIIILSTIYFGIYGCGSDNTFIYFQF